MARLLPAAQRPRRQAPAVLLARLRSAPTAPVGIPPATLATLVRTQVQLLRTLLGTILGTIAELESRIATRVACHPRAQLLASLPGVGIINLAQLLAEVGPILDRVPSTEHAAECGAAPVTKASGKTSGVYFRWAANRRARKALTAFAHNSRVASPWAGRWYAEARARGKRNPTPPASSLDAWLRSSGPAGSKPALQPHLHTAALQLQRSHLDLGD
jgi:transposase